MKRWLSHRWSAVCLLVLANFLPAARASVAEAQGSANLPFKNRVQTVELTLPNGDEADVYYPRTPSSKAFTDAYPIVVVLQGANVDKMHYEHFSRRLAVRGFVVVVPNHYRLVAPPPAPPALFTSRTVVTNVLEQMKIEDADQNSPLYRIVDTETLALVGHSFGGVVGLFASAVDACVGPPIPPFCDEQYERPQALRAAAFYGTNLVQNGFSLNFNTTGVAIALLQGSLDGSALPEDAALTYPTLEQPRALISIEGANHYGICDENNPLGAIPDPTPPTLDQERAVTYVAKWAGFWLRAQLKNDRAANNWLYKIGGTQNGVITVQTD